MQLTLARTRQLSILLSFSVRFVRFASFDFCCFFSFSRYLFISLYLSVNAFLFVVLFDCSLSRSILIALLAVLLGRNFLFILLFAASVSSCAVCLCHLLFGVKRRQWLHFDLFFVLFFGFKFTFVALNRRTFL